MGRIYACFAALSFSLCALAAPLTVTIKAPSDVEPIAFGLTDLQSALMERGYEVGDAHTDSAAFEIVAGIAGANYLPPDAPVAEKPESFAIAPRPGSRQVFVVGRDEAGAMYGLLELAERIKLGKPLAEVEQVTQSPFLEFRATNPFLSIPYPFTGEWDNWWFLSEDFWRTYLDMLARARFNWVDIHGMYDVRITNFPNIYPYFVDSKTFPRAGIDDAQKAVHMAMLRRVVAMAKARGIRIALMSYHASWNVRGAPRAPYEQTEDKLALYTRECVAEMLRQCPDLGMIGFRIGESGKSEGFYQKSYLPGIADSGLDIPLHTRTWGANKPKILEIGEAYPGRFIIEIKYNGEQFGLPYIVSGGRMTRWGHYSYQDYCRPPQAYKIVWQNRANGTHRLFRWGDPEWTARSVRSCVLDGAVGVSLESINTYFPQHDYYHKLPDLKWFKWVVERDWFWYMLWGRLSYNPDIGEEPWLAAFSERFGPDLAETMLSASQSMSMIIPLIYSAHCLGPDHRNMAPEFETGGSLDQFATVQPLDTFSMQSIPEYVQRLVNNNPSARTTPLQMADMIQENCSKARSLAGSSMLTAQQGGGELLDWRADITCLTFLGEYYANKLRAATYLQLYQATRDLKHWERAKAFTSTAIDKWRALSEAADEYYVPFVDTLRMHTEKFHWKNYLQEVEGDQEILERVKQEVAAEGGDVIEGVEPRHVPDLPISVTATPATATNAQKAFLIRVSRADGRPLPADARAFLRYKHLPSELNWRNRAMRFEDGAFEGTLKATPLGAQWAVEVVSSAGGACWPDWRSETPYRIIEAWDGPAPAALSDGKMPDLTGFDISRSRFGAVICGRIAGGLHGASRAQKKALLDQVAAGQSLVIFDQDYPERFDASWLPGDIQGTDADFDELETLGPHPILSRLPDKVRITKIVNDGLFGGDDKWQRLTEPWGLAVRDHGKGRIVLVQLRLLETIGGPVSRRLVTNILTYARGGSDKPLFILDEGNGILLPALDSLGVDYLTAYDLAP